MKLTVAKRQLKKSETARLRRAGDIPAVMYSPGNEPSMICIKGDEFRTVLRKMKQGHLSTTVFTLQTEEGEKKAIVKEIQYDVTKYHVTHLDFQELEDGVPVRVNVPIQCGGVADCVGIKLGGFLRQVIRCVKVSCLPKDIPQEFTVDIKDLAIGHSKRLETIPLPKGVTPLAPMKEVVVAISKRQ
jgi:large subunit ribosomal protein L25